MTSDRIETNFTEGPWALIAPISTGASEPGLPKTYGDPDTYTIKAQPAPFMRGMTVTIAEVYGRENAALMVRAPDLYEALLRLVFAARTSGGVAGRDADLCDACAFAEDVILKVREAKQ